MGEPHAVARLKKAERLPKVARLRLMGWPIRDIADALEVGKSTIERDLAELDAQWREDALAEIDRHKARECARLDLIIREALTAWDGSKGEIETRTARDVATRHGGTVTLTGSKVYWSPGNPKYLEQAIAAVTQKCRILGLEAPTQLNVEVRRIIEAEAAEMGLDADELWRDIADYWDAAREKVGA